MNIADLVFIVFIAIFAYIGYKRGLMLSLYSVFSLAISIAVGFILRKPVTAVIESTSIPDKINESIFKKLSDMHQGQAGEATVNVRDYIEKLKLPSFVENFLEKNIENQGNRAFESVASDISDKLTSFLTSVMAFVVILIAVILIMQILKVTLKVVNKLPVIKQFDKLGGVIFGVTESLIVASIIILVIYLFSAKDSFKPVISNIEESMLVRIFYEKNFLASIISKLKVIGSIYFGI